MLPTERVVLGLAAVHGLVFGVGALAGYLWLRIRLGPLQTRRVMSTLSVVVLLAGLRVLHETELDPAVARLGRG